MAKIAIAITLVLLYAGYSLLIYTKGTQENIMLSKTELPTVSKGKQLYQQYHCQSCHHLYGLGGYLGPDLTTAYSDAGRGKNYIKAMLRSGGNRMPDFHFSGEEIEHLTAYLKYVDSTASSLRITNNK